MSICKQIGEGSYGKICHPPRDDTVIDQKYRHNKKYIQRYTDVESWRQIKNGEKARRIFDPENTMSSPILAIYDRPNGAFSEIMPFREDSLYHLITPYKYRMTGNLPLFWKLMTNILHILGGMKKLHSSGWTHHDIKSTNILYDSKPELKLYLIDWATSLPFLNVYDEDHSNWHTATIENLPPEYKSYAHFRYNFPLKGNDFALEFSYGHPWITNILKIQPLYLSMLRRAHQHIQKELSIHHNNLENVINKISPKCDIYALGIVIAQIYVVLTTGEKNMSSFVRKQFIHLIRSMIHPDPFRRWDSKTSYKYLERIIQSHKR